MKPEQSPQSPEQEVVLENKEHYTYQVQLLIDAYNQGLLPEVERVAVEPRYGYVSSILYKNGHSRILYGHDSGFNAGSSEQLAKDKGYTKFLLRELGVNCPDGDEFLLPWWSETLAQSDRQKDNQYLQSTREAHAYIQEQLEYPVYVKPASGSQGSGVQKVYDEKSLSALFEDYETERVKVALVETAVNMPDYRLLFFDGDLVNAYRREPFSIVGDGVHSVDELTQAQLAAYERQGRTVTFENYREQSIARLGRIGVQASDIIEPDEKVQLLDISNLSAGGTPIDITTELHPHWVELGRKIAKGFNLRICGVDLACDDISSGDSNYSVLEVNATPGAKQFMASGETGKEKLEQMFLKFFNSVE